MTEQEIFQKLLEKYKFFEIIPDDIQRYVIRSKKRILKSSLKAVDDLGFFYSFVISVFFMARTIGFRPSVYMSKIIMLIISLIITGIIVSGLLMASFNIIPLIFQDNAASTWIIQDFDKESESGKVSVIDKQDQAYDEIISEKPSKIPEISKGSKKEQTDKKTVIREKNTDARQKKPVKNIRARLGITDLVPAGTSKTVVAEISKKLYRNLRNLRGNESVIYLSRYRKQKNVNRQLMGRLSKLGSSYVLAVRVVDTSTGDVLYDKTITYKKDTQIDDKIADIVHEINNMASIWELVFVRNTKK